jgi:ubiquitin C-terminal hydrolase
MHRLFNLRTKQTWVCQDCDEVHVNSEKETGLILAMPDNKGRSRDLQWYLRQHFAKETLQGVECHSAACRIQEGVFQKGDRERSSQIVGGPEILVIQLVRMRMDDYGGSQKVTDRVKYPDRLDLSQYSNGCLSYQLNGVVAHNGTTLSGGHYVAVVRSQRGKDFVFCNDDVEIDDQLTKEQALAKLEGEEFQSYLLVYQKIGGRMVNCI